MENNMYANLYNKLYPSTERLSIILQLICQAVDNGYDWRVKNRPQGRGTMVMQFYMLKEKEQIHKDFFQTIIIPEKKQKINEYERSLRLIIEQNESNFSDLENGYPSKYEKINAFTTDNEYFIRIGIPYKKSNLQNKMNYYGVIVLSYQKAPLLYTRFK